MGGVRQFFVLFAPWHFKATAEALYMKPCNFLTFGGEIIIYIYFIKNKAYSVC